jgi:hypothetical protein
MPSPYPPSVHVIPLKNGLWKVAVMTPGRAARWRRAWDAWWQRKGRRLAISPEMWVEREKPPSPPRGIAGEE